MEHSISKDKTISLGNPRFDYHGKYLEPTVCPLCKHAIDPVELHCHIYTDESDSLHMGFFYLCKHCFRVFTVLHDVSLFRDQTYRQHTFSASVSYVGPQLHEDKVFDEAICKLSPQFVRIYNQAYAAEDSNLDEIAGIGYRKALEFLIKDFCLSEHPDDKESILSMPLGACIKKYIDNQQISDLASRSVWLGNDETHYIRKHEDRDITDLKRFIQATAYFVAMSLISKEASAMPPA